MIIDCFPQPQHTNVQLPEHDVHVWCVSLDQPLSNVYILKETLTGDEQLRAKHFHCESDRIHFIVARGVLRKILGYYLERKPDQLRFAYDTYGKPKLREKSGVKSLCFNLSHSYGFALYALTWNCDIGVDIERVRNVPEVLQIINQFFSHGEYKAFRNIPNSKKPEVFFRSWTCKEAFLKACGKGLAMPLDQVEVFLTPGKQSRFLNIRNNPNETTNWSLYEIGPIPGYAAAVVVKGQVRNVKCWRWQL